MHRLKDVLLPVGDGPAYKEGLDCGELHRVDVLAFQTLKSAQCLLHVGFNANVADVVRVGLGSPRAT